MQSLVPVNFNRQVYTLTEKIVKWTQFRGRTEDNETKDQMIVLYAYSLSEITGETTDDPEGAATETVRASAAALWPALRRRAADVQPGLRAPLEWLRRLQQAVAIIDDERERGCEGMRELSIDAVRFTLFFVPPPAAGQRAAGTAHIGASHERLPDLSELRGSLLPGRRIAFWSPRSHGNTPIF